MDAAGGLRSRAALVGVCGAAEVEDPQAGHRLLEEGSSRTSRTG